MHRVSFALNEAVNNWSCNAPTNQESQVDWAGIEAAISGARGDPVLEAHRRNASCFENNPAGGSSSARRNSR